MATVATAETHRLTLDVSHEEELAEGAFVELGESGLIAQITRMETAGGSYRGEASIIGAHPDRPVPEGTQVNPASAEQIISALGLVDGEAHIGTVRGVDAPINLEVDALMRNQIGVFGRTGSGKSYTAAVLIEELLEHDRPVVIIDPHGEYASLQITTDDDPSDYPVVQYANTSTVPAADHELDPDLISIEDLAKPGQATVVNLLGCGDRQEELVARILGDLFDARKNGQRIPETKIVVEEAHEFAAKRKSPAKSVITRIAKQGRKFRFTLTIVSQRPSGIDTDVRAQLQATAIHKLTDDTDVEKAIDVTEGIDRNWAAQVQKLRTGECILAGDVLVTPTFVDVRERRTKHSDDDAGGLFDTTGQVVDWSAIQEQQSELAEVVEDTTADELREYLRVVLARRDISPDDLDSAVLQSKLEDRDERIADLEASLQQKDEEIKRLRTRLSETSHERTETTDPFEESSREETRGTRASPQAGTTDDDPPRQSVQTDPKEETNERGPSERQKPESPRTQEEVLSIETVRRVVANRRERIRALSDRERRMLAKYARRESATPDEIYRALGGMPNTSEATEMADTLVDENFLKENFSDDTYTYILDDYVRNRLRDVLYYEEEFEYAVEAVEEAL